MVRARSFGADVILPEPLSERSLAVVSCDLEDTRSTNQ